MRLWNSSVPNDGTIHCLGNGRLCVYAQGPNLIQVFGPPYSAPSLYHLTVEADAPLEVHSTREPSTALWRHVLLLGGQPAGDMLDFVDTELACFVRHLQLSAPLSLHLQTDVPIKWIDNGVRWHETGATGGLLLEAPAGQPLYHTYPFPAPIFHQIVWRGPVRAAADPAQRSWMLHCEPGEATFFLVGGPDYATAITQSEAALRTPLPQLVERTRAWWQGFRSSGKNLEAMLPPDIPQRAPLLQIADDVAVLIKAQQAAEGGVLAGYPYHMGYVRDQYGVSRGLLALGHTEAARQILDFYWQIWQRHGRIHNAQALGVDGVFHVHENDRVELTGYLLQQAFDLYAVTGDNDWLAAFFPMLAWALEVQETELVEGMLPFNGDETYIAGGILPRTTLNDGSAEATLLFLDGGSKLLAWAAQQRRWPPETLAAHQQVLDATRARYRANFWQGGRLLTNNPRRAALADLPRFRHGVCERCLIDRDKPIGVLWTERNAHGRYLCPECLSKGDFPAATPTVYTLQSVSLTPFYLHSSLFTPDELAPVVEEIVVRYQQTGRLPSRPDDTGTPGAHAVGYDYGMLLYALTTLGHPLAPVFYEKTLSLTDPAGAWAEYYIDDRPVSTRCRPWESAINLEACLRWAHSRPC